MITLRSYCVPERNVFAALVTKSNLPEGVRERSFILTDPGGTRRSFDNLVELAQWAAAIAFGKPDSEWLSIGQELK